MICKNATIQSSPCNCRACKLGCETGSGLLAGEDAKKIAEYLGITLEELKRSYLDEIDMFNKKMLKPKTAKKPYGKCIFYSDGCNIHVVKPTQCKIAMNCRDDGNERHSWFIINHVLNVNDPEAVRQYAVYLESGGKLIPGGSLSELVPDKKLLDKMLSYEMVK